MDQFQKIQQENNKRSSLILAGFSNISTKGLNTYTTAGINRLFDDLSKGDDADAFNAGCDFLDTLIPVKPGSDTYVSELDILNKGGEARAIGYITPNGKYMKTATGWKAVPKNHQHEHHATSTSSDGHTTTTQPIHHAPVGEKAVAASKANDPNRKHISVNDRWNHYETALHMVLKGKHKAAIAYGSGGIGKTFTLKNLIDKMRHESGGKKGIMYDEDYHDTRGHEYDFVKVTGKNTLTDFWRNLYEHNGKTIIFDDCDSVLKHKDVINILKGGLDTTGDGTIEYKKLKGDEDDEDDNDDKGEEEGTKTFGGYKRREVPKRFKFHGRIIFISNIGAEEFKNGELQPLKSRALTVNLTMNKDETIERLRKIMPKMPVNDADGEPIKGVTLADKEKAVKFIEDHKNEIHIGDFNARTFGTIVKCVKEQQEGTTSDWKGLASMMLGLEHYSGDEEDDNDTEDHESDQKKK